MVRVMTAKKQTGTAAGLAAGLDTASPAAAAAETAAGAALAKPLTGKGLRDAEQLARGELAGVTELADIGELISAVPVSAHSHSLRFGCAKASYVGWEWEAIVTRLTPRGVISVTELALVPGPDALVAPAWVPWSQRLAEYRESRAAAAAEEAAAAAAAALLLEEDEVDPAEDLLDNDFVDFDDEIDGVNIDDLDPADDTE